MMTKYVLEHELMNGKTSYFNPSNRRLAKADPIKGERIRYLMETYVKSIGPGGYTLFNQFSLSDLSRVHLSKCRFRTIKDGIITSHILSNDMMNDLFNWYYLRDIMVDLVNTHNIDVSFLDRPNDYMILTSDLNIDIGNETELVYQKMQQSNEVQFVKIEYFITQANDMNVDLSKLRSEVYE